MPADCVASRKRPPSAADGERAGRTPAPGRWRAVSHTPSARSAAAAAIRRRFVIGPAARLVYTVNVEALGGRTFSEPPPGRIGTRPRPGGGSVNLALPSLQR